MPQAARSHALRGNASRDAPRSGSVRDAERPGLHSHAERGNDRITVGFRSGRPRSARIAPINSLRLPHERADSSDPIQPRRRLRLQDFPAGAGSDSGR
ncbi:hypothetical protein PkoCFBP13504_21165 [Pseudomonas koreensis]|nr:hypothetical protein PkoCFBP13504_21165 [Pseudomonas koreensis]